MPTIVATNIDRNASSSVIGRRDTIVWAIGSSRWSAPRSPCTASHNQCPYCTGSGRSSRYLWRTAAITSGSRFSAPSAIAGSPGIARTPRKTTMLASRSTTRAAPALRRRKPPIVSAPTCGLLVVRERDAQQRVRVQVEALHLRRQAGPRHSVEQVDQGPVVDDDLRRLRVELLAGVFRRSLACFVEDRIELRVRVAAVVLRARRRDELVDVAVRVDPAGPPDLERFVRPRVGLRQRRHEVDRVDHDVNPDCFLLRLDELSLAEGDRARRHHEMHGRIRDSRPRDELLRVGRIVRRALHGCVVPRARRGDRRAAGQVRPVEHDLVQGFAVDRLLERLAQGRARRDLRADVRVRQLAEAVLVPEVDRDPLVAEARRLEDLQAGRALDARELRGRDSIERLEVAGLERGGCGRGVVLDLEDDLVEMDVLLGVVVRRLDDRDAVARDATVEHERADAHGGSSELVAELRELCGRHDHPRAVGELRRERRVRRLEVEHDRVRTLGRDAVDRRELARAGRSLQRLMALDRRHDGGGVERRAVVELDPPAQRDRDGEPVLREPRQRGGELRPDAGLVVEVVQLLAEREEDLTAGEGSCERRVEDVGLARGHTDVERAPVLNRRLVRACGGGDGEGEESKRGSSSDERGARADSNHGMILPSRSRPIVRGMTGSEDADFTVQRIRASTPRRRPIFVCRGPEGPLWTLVYAAPHGAASGLVQPKRTRSALAEDSRPVRDPRQRGDAAADAGGARRPTVRALAGAVADRRGACRSDRRRRDRRVAGARLQPPRAQPPPRGVRDRRARLARRPHEAARRRRLHRGRRPQLRARRGRHAGGHERPPRAGADRAHVLAAQRAGADGSRRDGVPRAGAALRGLPARGALPVAWLALRAAAPAGAVRGLVPAATRARAAGDRGGGRPAGRRRRRSARARRARRRRRRYPRPADMTRYDDLIAKLREAAQPQRPAPPAFGAYLEKVRLHAYKVTDGDVQALKDAGYSEDEIFEQTVSVATVAGLERLEAGMRALG